MLMRLLIILPFLIIFISNSYSEKIKFEATSIEIIDKDKIIIAKEGVKIFSGNEIVIDADQMRYEKENKFLEASGNIIITNEKEGIKIISDDITYDKKKEKIIQIYTDDQIKTIDERVSIKEKEIMTIWVHQIMWP